MRGSRSGFTLIELLIVIGIIGVLATLAVVNVSSSREKARVAKAAAYASQMKRAAGDMAVALWDMDDCIGSTVVDRSGFGNNASVANTTWITNTPVGQGCALSFDGTSSYVNGGTSPTLNVANLEFSVCAWFRTAGTGASEIFSNSPAANGGFALMVYMGHLRSQVWYSGNGNTLDGVTTVNDDKWHYGCHVVEPTRTVLIVDGRIDASATLTGTKVRAASSNMFIGARAGVSSFFSGSIDDVSVYTKALTLVNVNKSVAVGL